MNKITFLSALTTVAILSPTIQANDLNINGFLSVGVSMLDNSDVTLDGYDTTGNFKNDTILGLQISKLVNDKTTVTGQLVSRGTDDYSTESAWAYASYAVSDDLDVRLGRIRVPFFYYSDFLEVGYAYDWVRPPTEVYNIPFSSIDGTDLNYRFALGDWDNSVQLYYGRYSRAGSGVDLKNFTGLALSSSTGNFSLRGSYHRLEIETDGTGSFGAANAAVAAGITALKPLLNPTNDAARDAQIDQAATNFALTGQEIGFYGLAAGYDNGDISAIAEYTLGFGDTSFFPEGTTYLAKFGKRFGEFLGHLTYAVNENKLDSGLEGDIQKALGLESKQSSIIAGLRYDYDTSTALKFEVQNHDEEIVGGAKGESAMLYTVAIDVVF
jgi:hypothetical protein